MGSGLVQKYNSKPDLKMKAIQPDIEPLFALSIGIENIEYVSPSIKKSYATLSNKGIDGMHSGGKGIHAGATKILHLINPELFPIVDSNAAKTLRELFGLPYKNNIQPGYSVDLYLKSIVTIKEAVEKYDFREFQALETKTPIMRIFDKLTFTFGNGW